jgi:outer membrane receptor protein involved in Fe transport
MSARTHRRKRTPLALWLCLALVPVRPTFAADLMRFDIPAGPATETLVAYTTLTGFQALYGYDAVRDIRTNAVHGELDPVTALEQMTQGTRLRYEFMDSDTVTLTVTPSQRARTQSAAPSATPDVLPPAIDRRSLYSEIETVTVRSKLDRPTLEQMGSPLLVLSKTDIDAIGFTTVQDVIRTLPQIFGGGPSEDTRQIGFEARTNAALGVGINLRGLGAGSTLVLINGRRMAGGGTEGIFTDIASIPLSVVERIEILPDSSSTIYGADAVGGVVNFVLLDTMHGAQTEASYGAATHGQLNDNHVSQLVGIHSRWLDGLLGFDFYARDHLPTADRAQAHSDLRDFGGDNFDVVQSNPATIIVGNRQWGVPRGQDGTHLTPSNLLPDQPNRTNRYAGADLLPSQQRWSLYATGKKAVSDTLQLFGDALFSERDMRNSAGALRASFIVPASNPFSPFKGVSPVQVAYDFVDDLGAMSNAATMRTLSLVAGGEMQLPDEWHLTATADFGSERLRTVTENTLDAAALARALADPNPATALNVFGDGSHTNPATVAGLRSSSLFTGNSQVMTGNVTFNRELRTVRNGVGKLVAGLDYRDQTFDTTTRTRNSLDSARQDLGRRVGAGFAALSLPIVAKRGDGPGPNRLEMSLAARYEDYSDFGHIVTPRFGLTWAPADALAMRATWSSSFRPPNLLDLDESSNFVTPFALANPAAPSGQSLVLVEAGKNAQLREERAHSWTVGLDLKIPFVPGLTTGFTYFKTKFTDRMDQPLASGALLTDPSLAAIVTRAPTFEQQQAFCSSAPLFNISAEACRQLPVQALVDLRVRNSALMRTDGIDLLAEYARHLGPSALTFRLDGTYILSFAEASSRDLALSEKVSTQNNPIDLRLRGAGSWQYGGWRTSALVTYYDNYRDLASTPNRHVRSWTTLDLSLAYATGKDHAAAFSGLTFALSAENVFDQDPPFLNNQVGLGYDQENGELTGRILSFSVRKNW